MQQLFCDGRNSLGGSSSDITLQLSQPLQVASHGQPGLRRFRVDSLRIPNVFPTISAYNPPNNKLRFTAGPTKQTYNALVASGNYEKLSDLCVAIAKGMNDCAPPAIFKCTSDDAKMEIKLTTEGGTTAFGIDNTIGLGRQLLARPLYDTTVTDGQATSFTFTQVTLRGMDVIYLSSNVLSNGETVGARGSSDTVLQINVTEPYGAVIERSMATDVWLPLPKRMITHLNFTLRDRNYTPLTMIPTFSLVLTVSP
jgi:hypothetical protein